MKFIFNLFEKDNAAFLKACEENNLDIVKKELLNNKKIKIFL